MSAVYLFIGFSLVFDILFDDGFIATLPNGVEIESARPELTAPEQFVNRNSVTENLVSQPSSAPSNRVRVETLARYWLLS